MRAESWKAIRIPESARAWRRWHASIMPDSSTPATVFPSAARAASRTSATSFHPHDSTKTRNLFGLGVFEPRHCLDRFLGGAGEHDLPVGGLFQLRDRNRDIVASYPCEAARSDDGEGHGPIRGDAE